MGLIVALFGWWRATTRGRRRNKVRQRIAQDGEGGADALLRAHGYEVLDHQVIVEFPIEVDGEEHWVQNRCDRVVRRDGLFFVAEIKTGTRAPDPLHPATRRQLLEYLLTHEADGVLLVDMDAEELREVRFPMLEQD